MRRGSSLVLLYHRVAEEEVDPLGMCVSPAHFEEQLATLQKIADVVPASMIGTAPAGSVAITFDDGYADVFAEALPRLERREMPSTVFLVTRALEDGAAYWWDRLVAGLFDEERSEPARLTIDGKTRVFGLTNRLTRRLALRRLFGRIRAMREEERAEVIAQLDTSSPGAAMHRLPKVATREEVRSMRCELVEIGSHTTSHPSLSSLSAAEKSTEIVGSKRLLEEQFDIQVRAFAYPFGSRRTFDDEAVREVRSAGYACAFANVPGSFRSGDDVFRVPRRGVGDWAGPVFEKRLRRWLRGG